MTVIFGIFGVALVLLYAFCLLVKDKAGCLLHCAVTGAIFLAMALGVWICSVFGKNVIVTVVCVLVGLFVLASVVFGILFEVPWQKIKKTNPAAVRHRKAADAFARKYPHHIKRAREISGKSFDPPRESAKEEFAQREKTKIERIAELGANVSLCSDLIKKIF